MSSLVIQYLSNCRAAVWLASLFAFHGLSVLGQFTSVTDESGLSLDINGLQADPVFNSGAFAVVDINDDGWLDLYATRSQGGNYLYVNQKDGTFIESASVYGLEGPTGSNGAVFADFDNDGDPDLFLTAIDSPRYYFYINQGGGVFTEEAESRGAAVLTEDLLHRGYSVTVSDYDLDGWLDLHVCDYYGLGQVVDPATHSVLLRNRGAKEPGHFENVTIAAGVGIVDEEGRQHSFAAAMADFNQDSWPDLTVTGDYNTSRFFFNNGDGTFRDATDEVGANKDENGMGIAVGDYDGDLDLDFYVTSIFDNPGLPQPEGLSGNRMYRFNSDTMRFSEVSLGLGIRDGGFGWGTTLFDADNDADLDLLATNGIFFQDTRVPEQTRYWENDGNGDFSLKSDEMGIVDQGEGYGVLSWDYDNDGDLDLLVGQKADVPILYRNDSENSNKWLRLSFEGVSSNRDGIGVKVLVDPGEGGRKQFFEYNPTNLFLAQSEPFLHIGLPEETEELSQIVVTWPRGTEQVLTQEASNRLIHLVEPDPIDPLLPQVRSQPTGGSFQLGDSLTLLFDTVSNPEPIYIWEKDGVPIKGENKADYTIERIHPYDAGVYRARAINYVGETASVDVTVTVEIDMASHSVARWWNEFLLEAIRKDFPAPTIHARNLYHVSAAMWDAYWAFEDKDWEQALPVFWKEELSESDWEGDRVAAQAEAISYAAFRVLMERYKNSEGKLRSEFGFRWLMEQLGYNPDIEETEGSSPAAVGNRIGLAVLAANVDDGANEVNDYQDPTEYVARNEPLVFELSGTVMSDPNRWQPLAFEYRVTQNGISVGESVQTFIGSNWRDVETFAVDRTGPHRFDLDPGPPPLLGTESEADFIEAALEVIRFSSLLDPSHPELIDISPGKRLNNTLGKNDGIGRSINPRTNEPYSTNVVKHADYGRVLAEFWADGPSSETPPGHWNALHNEITDDPRFERRYGGAGGILSPLEWDIQAYLALNGAMHDAAVVAWALKRQYDYARPISIIRYLGGLGQSSYPGEVSYHPQGLPLEPGLIEIVTAESAAPGERHEHLSYAIGEVAIFAWAGQPEDSHTEYGGVDWIRAVDWIPYQRSTFVTPAFAAYVSGHSTFSRAGAEVLTLLTGSPYFPGGLGEFHFEANEYLEFEAGPSESLTLQWATYYDAADQAGISRLYGGIHVSADDVAGRVLGARIGVEAYLQAHALRTGNSDSRGFADLSLRSPTVSGETRMARLSFAENGNTGLPVYGSSKANAQSNRRDGVHIYSDGPESIIEFAGQNLISLESDLVLRGSKASYATFEVMGELTSPVFMWVSNPVSDTGLLNTEPAGLALRLYRIGVNGDRELLAENIDWTQSETASVAEALSMHLGIGPLERGNGDAAFVALLAPDQYELEILPDDGVSGHSTLGIFYPQP